jgi:DNA/RNA endonuclease YhcR with UshA esterase domain
MVFILRFLIINCCIILVINHICLCEPVITPADTTNYYNRSVIIEGTVIDTYDSGKTCFLKFDSSFSAVIFSSNYKNFPRYPDDYYYRKKVKVHGVVRKYKDSPEIILDTQNQIELLEPPTNQILNEIISWEDADEYYNKIVTVEGQIVGTYLTEKVCYLNFHNNWKRYLTIKIYRHNLNKFNKNLDEYYLNKIIRVTGLIRRDNNRPVIIVKEPDQIKVVK